MHVGRMNGTVARRVRLIGARLTQPRNGGERVVRQFGPDAVLLNQVPDSAWTSQLATLDGRPIAVTVSYQVDGDTISLTTARKLDEGARVVHELVGLTRSAIQLLPDIGPETPEEFATRARAVTEVRAEAVPDPGLTIDGVRRPGIRIDHAGQRAVGADAGDVFVVLTFPRTHQGDLALRRHG